MQALGSGVGRPQVVGNRTDGVSPVTPGMPAALIPPSCDEGPPGVLRDHSLEKQQAQVKHCRHPAGSGSPARGLTHLSLGLQVKVWRLPKSGQDMPSGAGLTLGPGGGPVDVLQFHPTADGVLASGAGKRVTVWDVGQQQPLTGRHGRARRLLPATCVSTVLVAWAQATGSSPDFSVIKQAAQVAFWAGSTAAPHACVGAPLHSDVAVQNAPVRPRVSVAALLGIPWGDRSFSLRVPARGCRGLLLTSLAQTSANPTGRGGWVAASGYECPVAFPELLPFGSSCW